MKWNKFWIKEAGKEYDAAKRQAAAQRAALYYLVAIYIGYMGYSIIKNRLAGDTTMSYPLAIILTVVLVLGAVWVIWIATRRMKNEFEKSVIENVDQDEGIK